MVDMAHFSGLVAGHGYRPIDYADVSNFNNSQSFKSGRGGIILTNRRFI